MKLAVPPFAAKNIKMALKRAVHYAALLQPFEIGAPFASLYTTREQLSEACTEYSCTAINSCIETEAKKYFLGQTAARAQASFGNSD